MNLLFDIGGKSIFKSAKNLSDKFELGKGDDISFMLNFGVKVLYFKFY
ncbi:hypothetical protein [Clostridium beijerinckii]|uniref:Uncharacterized protein n=1 Tax=Clostridium beijerinckii TaxID=1520 RepID=A0AAE5H8A3_CLOBE|nr:hypothetical protein [Clostridium beijerinckii]NSB17170.1 hypothetical protein [Clostridium beijerinckii]